MRLSVFAIADDIYVIKNSGLGAARCAIHKILDLFAMTLLEQRKALEAGNHIQRRTSRETPSQLRRRELQLARTLLLFLPRVESDDGDEAKNGREDDNRKKNNPHFMKLGLTVRYRTRSGSDGMQPF